ncbi:RNA-directed DNA polymerase [Emticicia oligotrophica]|uniref:RNA-directed DNA polymerase n=1 Tax=Emticicia oligotrophica TaxID=312279 RepID=UPI00273C1386|nr:RNA-directed DNA polymerase [Emticicia oligotrophica]
MTLFDLLERGYFPKELPPPYNTEAFATQSAQILLEWNAIFVSNTDHKNSDLGLVKGSESNTVFKERKKEFANSFISKYNSSKGAIFSISKGKLSRRFLQIPNPKHFLLLCEKIATNWTAFATVFALSNYSKSFPIPETLTTKRSVSTFSKSVSDFRNELLNTSFDKIIEIRVDISKFYPTIYTHSIAWALLGKEKAKYYFKQKDNIATLIAGGDLDASLYKFAESVDMAVRSCQERQSIGIPIGPDTSHIIAETVACRIDSIINSKFSSIGLKACRYYDDFYLYVSSKDEADKVLKGIQLILADFQLEMNESKIRIKEFPFAIEDEFALQLFSFTFKDTNFGNSLKHYFSLVWSFAEKNPKKADTIFKYSLRTFEYCSTKIPKNTWKIFEDLLFKTALIEPSILDIVTRVLLTYKSYLDLSSKEKLKNVINKIINEHSPVNHNFEVSWALWLAKTFEITIDEISANNIIRTKDSISNLILLDLINNTALVIGTPSINDLEVDLKDDILFSENWLLAYEGVKKGWLNPANPNLLDDNLFFKLLKDKNIEFYDATNQISYASTEIVPLPAYDITSIEVKGTATKIPINLQPEFMHLMLYGLDT